MTFCDMSGPNNRSGQVFFLKCALLTAIAVTVGASSANAVGLTYIDGRSGSSFGEPANIFRTNGASLGTPGAVDVFTSETNLDTDNAWGWRDFGATNVYYDPTPGVVDLDYASVYEASGNNGDENAPEFQMRLVGGQPDGLGGTINISPSTAYDVYVAYWSDAGANWAIRGGLQPGTTQAPLPVFANYTTTVANETPGTFASSGAWDNPPLDNPTDENATGANDSNSNPFLDVTPGAPVTSNRNMLLGFLGTVTSGSQAGAAANEIRVWIDDLPGGGRRSWFDGLAFVPAGTNVFWSAQLDRDQKTLTVTNDTSQSYTVVGYSILSAAGSLDGSGANNAPWNNLTAGTLAGFTDTDNDWSVVGTPSALSTELREQDGGLPAGAQDGIVVAPGGELDFGGLWQLAPFEDIQVVLRLADATPETFDDNPLVTIFPTYSGTAAVRGDFTGDGVIDVQDYIRLMQNLQKPQGTATRTVYYRNGDFNDDNVVDRNDFFLFRGAYFQANPGAGAGGFAAMAAEAARIMGRGAVPEPSTLLLLVLGGGCLCGRSRRRARDQVRHLNKDLASMIYCKAKSHGLGAAALALVVALVLSSGAQAVPVVGWGCDSLSGNCDPSQVFDGETNSPTFGDGTAEAADDFGVWGATPSNVHLDSNFEAVLSGKILMTGADAGNGRDFRWGMWKRVDNGAPQATGAWLGYMAEGGSGGNPGRLQARNPDDPGFSTASFLSDFGGGSIATTSGPAPAAGPGSQFTDFNNAGTGTGRYFLLAEPPVNNNALYNPNISYTFQIRVGRYGDEVDVSGSLIADTVPAAGDYNNDNVVNAADYTVWRNSLGQPASTLPNRAAANMATTVDASHYDDWKANFGNTGGSPFTLRLGGGLDFDGRPPAALDTTTMEPVPYTSHLTFDFDRVGFLFGNQMNADQVQLENVDISVSAIQTLDLLVNTTTGEVSIRNNLATPFNIDYYEITSTLGVLESDNWNSLDAADGGLPVTNDYLTGWDIAEGSGDFVLSEGNFVGSTTVATGSPISLGNVFKTGTAVGDRDIRFFAGVAGGGVVRGTVTYSSSGVGSLAAVPEPATTCLLLWAGALWAVASRRNRPV
jgi:PEP-CTERM motif